MASTGRAFLVTKDSGTAEAVRTALKSGETALAEVCGALPDLVAKLDVDHASSVIVDLGDDPRSALKELQGVISRFTGMPFVVLAAASDNALIFESMVIGARYFLIKDSIESSLAGVLERLAQNSHHVPLHSGAAISVFSAGGGCGATTVAVNLANELKLLSSKRTLLVDLDAVYGAAGVYLGVSSQYGIADVLSHDGEIDPSLIDSSSLLYSDNLHVLVSPATVDLSRPQPLRYENVPSVFEACKHAYGYTVVDAPRMPMDVAASLADASAACIIVFQLQVKDIRYVRAMISALEERGVSPKRIIPVANRYRKHNPMVSLAESREALPDVTIECIANDYRSALRGINYGQPLAQAASRSILRKDIRRLAVKIDQMVRSSGGR